VLATNWDACLGLAQTLAELFRSEVLDAADIARVLGTNVRSVNRWAAERHAPRRDSEERFLELKAVVDLLRTVVRDETARLWLRSPNPDLDWHKPLDVVAQGEYRRVLASIAAMAEGVTA
jgi:uncharacterized protein (DUF2384 family)